MFAWLGKTVVLTPKDKIVVLDFGGQYCHLISRRIRDAGVFSEILPSDTSAEKIRRDPSIKGVILSGGARSVYEPHAPRFDKNVLHLPLPVLGICYGHQLIAHLLGGKVVHGRSAEYGLMKLKVKRPDGPLANAEPVETVWMNHGDIVVGLPKGFRGLAETEHSKIAAYSSADHRVFGLQFHPEVTHTEHGDRMLRDFAFDVCKCGISWSPQSLADSIVEEARDTLAGARAVIGLSGGVDSSVATMLVSKAIGRRLIAVYVDTGLMRFKETEFIRGVFAKADLDLRIVDAGKRFFRALRGVLAPERKRRIIGRLFADVFYGVAKREKADFLIQGTIYSDRIESGITKHSSKIKSHHNVGGLPKDLKLNLYEPLRDLYKDEVRNVARQIGLPTEITSRQVFPGPGLAIRIIGEVTPERTEIVRRASHVIEDELRKTELWKNIWMSFAVLLPVKSVGIQGDRRSYKYPVVVRIVESKDAMTANFSKVPFEILERISTRITNEIKEVNRVVYDVTSKPPATMEWE